MFEFCTSPRIIFGRGEVDRIGNLAGQMGKRAIVVRGGAHLDQSGTLDRIRTSFEAAGVDFVQHVVRGEPDITTIDEALLTAREGACDMVVGLGGGSALDAAKAVAGLLTMGGAALDYMEVVGRGQPIDRPAAPLIAVPTTAGTGTEVTRNAVLAYKPKQFKASMRSPHLIPRVALVDPQLTDSTPPEITASTGLDALTQVIEPYVSKNANPLSDALSLEGIRRAARALPRAHARGSDTQARDDMALASLLGGNVSWRTRGWVLYTDSQHRWAPGFQYLTVQLVRPCCRTSCKPMWQHCERRTRRTQCWRVMRAWGER